MNCPVCQAELTATTIGHIEIDGCPSCGGLWLDAGELQELANEPTALKEATSAFPARPRAAAARNCPRCTKALQPHEFASLRGIHLDRCPTCQGLWLDAGEAALIDSRLH
jgi:Zn-finger nucleic acid-binding protein